MLYKYRPKVGQQINAEALKKKNESVKKVIELYIYCKANVLN